jgi:phosphopantetheine adenylyltransferase
MLVNLCASNYATFDGLVNGVDDFLKRSTIYHEKTIIWIMFQNSKIKTLTKEKYNHY